MRFRDRTVAGQLLAGKLLPYAGRRDVLILALPRGGVPVAARQTCDEFERSGTRCACAP